MSSILASNGMVLATAMAAVSGTVILLAFRLQKSPPSSPTQFSLNVTPFSNPPKPCLSSDGGKKREKNKKKKKKKKVHFAEDVVDPIGNSDEFRRLRRGNFDSRNSSAANNGGRIGKMPANRMALYNGILRDRVVQRVGYSY